MAKQIGAGLLAYASNIWSSADILRGAGIKGSDFPKMMMPFFALMLLESRLIRQRNEMIAQFEQSYGRPFDRDPQGADVQQDLVPALKGQGLGFHAEIAETGLGLAHLAQVQGGNFLNRLRVWLDMWDPGTKRLLGVGYAQGQGKFLDMDGVSSDLQAKDVLWGFCQKWGSINLVPFDNSEVTTIEEHIKRKWADISADTAGEQYTPSDLIDLAVEIDAMLVSRNPPKDEILRVYDPTCGGGNFVFAAEDALRERLPSMSTVSRGQELNDALYALAAIESRFRPDSRFEYGNTLTNDAFAGEEFDVIVANPPYGVDWKLDEKQIKADASGRFAAGRMPPTSDGQLLFLQHIAHHLSPKGVASVVHSGSTLFSGDAGGGESETRKWLLQTRDIVEAVIQLPQNMFFNTGISTYLWILNADKPKDRKGKVLMVDASGCFSKLKKNLNKKNCEIDEANRREIVDAVAAFSNGPFSKVMEVDELLYNKVEISVTRKDECGRGVQAAQKIADVVRVDVDEKRFNVDLIPGGKDSHMSVVAGFFGGVDESQRAAPMPSAKECEAAFKEALRAAEKSIEIHTQTETWSFDVEGGTAKSTSLSTGQETVLGKGKPVLKTKVKGIYAVLDASVEPIVEKDTETVPFSSTPAVNDKLIQDFLSKWVKEPWTVVGTKVGCEINFNRLFPKKADIRSTSEILSEMALLDAEMKALEEEFSASLGQGGVR